jgi:anti-sigma factor RsiW
MNCRQIEKYLPLYAGHDLSGPREQLIAAHLQSCGACTEALADFQNARELMHTFAAPSFSDEVYADIRKRVWRRIESESRPTLFAAVAAWFQPRLVWTAATALLVTLSVVGVYVLAQKFTVRPKTIAGVPTIGLPSQSGPGENSGSDSSQPERPRRPRQADAPNRRQRPVRMVAPDRSIAAHGTPDKRSKYSHHLVYSRRLETSRAFKRNLTEVSIHVYDDQAYFSRDDSGSSFAVSGIRATTSAEYDPGATGQLRYRAKL